MLEIADGDVHVWFAFDDDIRSGDLFEAYRALLTDEERQKEIRFRFERDQRQYLVTRVLVRTVLTQYCGVKPQDWRFGSDERGRPHVIDAGTDVPQFNVSHTPGLIVCAVTGKRAIGVDAENVQGGRNSKRIAERKFSQQEAAELDQLPAELQAERFLHYWTLKEAYIKARGLGLAIPLTQFGFAFPAGNHVNVFFSPEMEDEPARWKFWLMQPSVAQVAAVCVGKETSPTRLTMRKVVPLESEEKFECPILRESVDTIA